MKKLLIGLLLCAGLALAYVLTPAEAPAEAPAVVLVDLPVAESGRVCSKEPPGEVRRACARCERLRPCFWNLETHNCWCGFGDEPPAPLTLSFSF